MIDSVVIPDISNEDVIDVDVEILFKKSLQESEGDFGEHRSNSKSVIDTRSYKGDLSRYMPSKGTFQYVHIDVDAKGGLAKIIEEKKKYGQH